MNYGLVSYELFYNENIVRRKYGLLIDIFLFMQAIAQNYTVTYCGENGHGSAVEFKENTKSDMFQLGRSTEPLIDFIVVDTVPGCKVWKIM